MNLTRSKAAAQAPNEDLLVQIFQRAATPFPNLLQGDFLTVFPFNVSLVCRSWRSAALGRSSLWASLSVEFTRATTQGSTRNILEITKMWIERSSVSPLDIRLCEAASGMELERKDGLAEHGFKEVVDLIFSQAHRWRDVLITSGYFPEDRRGRDHPFVIASPHLTDLMLAGTEESPTLFLDLSQSPRLYEVHARSDLTLLLAPPSHSPAMSRLNRLYVAMAKSQSIPDFIAFLKASPNLAKLEVSFAHITPDTSLTPAAAPLRMKRLRSLTVTLLESCGAPLTRFLSKLSCPALYSLGVEFPRRLDYPQVLTDLAGINEFVNNISHAHTTLSELFVKYKGPPDEADDIDVCLNIQSMLIQMLRPLKQVSFLVLEHLPIFDSLLQDLTCKDRGDEGDGDVLCPRLLKFLLSTSEPVDGLTSQVILDMLASRYEHGHMLEVVVFRIPYLQCQTDEFTKKMRSFVFKSNKSHFRRY